MPGFSCKLKPALQTTTALVGVRSNENNHHRTTLARTPTVAIRTNNYDWQQGRKQLKSSKEILIIILIGLYFLCLNACISLSCFLAASRLEKVPRFLRLPVLASVLRE